MHPNQSFRHADRALLEAMIVEIGFGTVFANTPDGPRVAHVPLLWTGDGAVQFHLSRGNALTKHLDGATALAVINGPDAYVSPRWYADGGKNGAVPTWNYVALELEGRVRRIDSEGLLGQITTLSEKYEAQVAAGIPWTMDKLTESALSRLLAAIVGFELEITAWRETFKLGQNKSAEDRGGVANGLEAQGSLAIAQLIRKLAP